MIKMLKLMFKSKSAKALGGYKELTQKDIDDFSFAKKRIWELMKDGRWHTASSIIKASGQREGLRRMRDLRPYFKIEKKHIGSRQYSYRILNPKEIV